MRPLQATALAVPGAGHGLEHARASVVARVSHLLKLKLIALVLIGLGVLPGVMAPSKPFTPIVPMSEGQGPQSPSEEDHPRADVGIKVFAEKHRRSGGLFVEPVPAECGLAAFLASLRPALRGVALVAPPDALDAPDIALRRRQLPRRAALDEEAAV
ncbi:hypothetical protein [Corallococcus sp. AS-1-6]|uniref:hypothetical protein n=1 Tax=Corallococcus TaxID=83461 RepID=UPI001CC0D4C6|nr:hypothetical protein [Corallococcus sp. AS-1-6]MBZ4376377.1 hypothetical protein [Corallococcus sp. AS-1-6]